VNLRNLTIFSAIVFVVASVASTQTLELPPVSWSCPMHPDVVETKAGKCPICNMDLKSVRLDTVWTCPVHSIVEEQREGKCPICRRELGQVNVAVSFTCPNQPEIDEVNPGVCANGAAMIPKRTVRSHGNHNPQHGGVFFMAPDNWHHLEGAYPSKGVFRLHLYDDYAKPLSTEKLREVAGRVVTREVFDANTQTMRDVASFPLDVNVDGRYLEAKIDSLELPAEMFVRIKFKVDGEEHRFDFVFPEFSEDRASIVTTGLAAIEIPDNTTEIVALLTAQSRHLRELIQKGAFGELYVPAFQAKDLALALEVRLKDLPLERRAGVLSAISRVVRGAWRLDAVGDQGNREQIQQTFEDFERSIEELQSAFSLVRR